MKTFSTLLLLLYISFSSPGQQTTSDSGFTNTAEAKNQMVNGVKDGKWIEYEDDNGNFTRKENSSLYELAIYKQGKPTGIVRCYSNNGTLHSKATYVNGKMDGVYTFYLSGKVVHEIPYKNGIIDGVAKNYYDNGTLSAETPYTYGKINGTEKVYSENGKLQKEILYKKGKMKEEKYYDKNGNPL